MIAETDRELGRLEDARAALEVAFASESDDRFWDAELHRVKGEILAQQQVTEEAERCFRRALEIARMQEAKSHELRAATSLGRLMQAQGRRHEAREMLAPVYDWFTEGFDTADLKDAKALLDELG